jgi:putative oxidoreductase
MKRAWLDWALRLLLAGVFLAAALPKIHDPAAFAEAIYRYQLLPSGGINALAIFLPWLELVAALALLAAPSFRAAAALLLAGMLAVFAAAMQINLIRGINIACGCFSVKPEAAHLGWLNIGRNLLLMAVGLFLLYRERRRRAGY